MSKIKVGVIGVGRGMSFADVASSVGMELVALCDVWEEKLNEAGKRLGVATYTDYDKFLEHDMDAVVLANYFHQHALFAIKALQAGKHVMSETSACKTMAEGVALARAVEKSGKIYFFAENYAYFAYVQEMRKLYQQGEIGDIMYAEGEYNHPGSSEFYNQIGPGMNHWRNHIPPTYYCTHAMSPIMYVTDTRPTSVNSLSVPQSPADKENKHVKVRDFGFVTICRMNNNAVARLFGLSLRGHSIWYRFHGSRGLMENLRTGNQSQLRILHEPWDMMEGDHSEEIYTPEFPVCGDLASGLGHGGGDFYTSYHFAEAIRRNEQPWMDVYHGLDMTIVGIQSWKSCLNNGAPYEIPDFRDENNRKRYEDDDWSPFPEDRKPGQPPTSAFGDVTPSAEAIAYAKEIWDKMGYKE